MTAVPSTQPVTPALMRRQLSESAFELAREYSSLPPGAVLRCFLRAARAVQMAGADPADVALAARLTAELMLQSRGATRTTRRAR